jgi:diguanylate cyclase (GGDEF)-like protein
MSDVATHDPGWRVVFNRASPPGHRGWGRVRAAQLAELGRRAGAAIWGQTLVAILLAFILSGTIAPNALATWLAALALLLFLSVKVLDKVRCRAVHFVSREVVDRAGYHSLLFGLLWAVPASFFFEDATQPQQLAICIVTASMMAGAAFTFSSVPTAAGAFIVTMGGSATGMLAHTGGPLVAAIGPAYTIALLLIVYSGGRAFMQRKCVEIALEERTETVSLLLRDYESSDADWLWQTNRNLVFRNVSTRFARAIGYSVAELERMSIDDLLARADGDAANGNAGLKLIMASIATQTAFAELIVPIAGSEGTRCIELSARPRFNAQGRFLGYRGVGSDVTEARIAADRIAHMARHDALTGLPNRLQILEALDTALHRGGEAGRVAILLIDLDRFKTVNDSLGHAAGDHLLRQVSSRFEPIIARDMTVGRLGGDEFALVIPAVEDRDGIERLCRKLIEALKQPFVYDEQYLFVGASIGIAVAPADGRSVEDLIRNADLALYRAKREGGNGTCFYEPGLHASAEERRRIELAMRSALDRGEFRLAYQPVIDSATASVRSFEALLRWDNPEIGMLSPARFIPVAEETGLIGRIGEWVLREACAEAANWPAEVSLAVNISPLQLQEPGFMATLISALSQTGLDPRRLELEITETVFLKITPSTQKILHQIHGLGVRLAIDDFGTGYSSLGYLRDTNFDTLKIDRSFVLGIREDDPESGAIVRAVVALAGSLGMRTIAEGVETEEQLALVRDLGCDGIQGYIFSDPVPGAEAKRLIGAVWKQAAA